MTCGLDEVKTGVDAVVNDFLPVDAVLLLEVRVEAGLNVLNDRLPARLERVSQNRRNRTNLTYHSSLLTKSPKPGVSTTVRRRRTPFSSMSDAGLSEDALGSARAYYSPALMLSMATVEGRSALGGTGTLGGYSVVLKRVLMRVDLPRPDSPARTLRNIR